MEKLFAFGFGYSAKALAVRLASQGWSIAGTARTAEKRDALRAQGFEAELFHGDAQSTNIDRMLEGTTHLLHSIPPQADGDPVLNCYGDALAGLGTLSWVGYLSTVGVYGDQQGRWVDETVPVNPNSARTEARVAAENAWLAFGRENGIAVEIFRLAGIYGPGRCAFDKLAAGTARRIVKKGQVFSRIHVDDIATILEASIARPRPGAIYNVADDEPAPPGDIIAYAADLMGIEPPPEIDYETADLSPMARSFYEGNRKIANTRIKSELGVKLRYRSFREGLAALKP
ncbi:MAG: SDR family oxidoreductase [Pseudomonadota bacterium]